MNITHVLVSPVITEKSTLLNEDNRYVFNVNLKATKYDIARAVEWAFDVKVVGVNAFRRRGKIKRRGRGITKSPDIKRAIVTLAQGDSITLFEGA